jgi:hypothetical protein
LSSSAANALSGIGSSVEAMVAALRREGSTQYAAMRFDAGYCGAVVSDQGLLASGTTPCRFFGRILTEVSFGICRGGSLCLSRAGQSSDKESPAGMN